VNRFMILRLFEQDVQISGTKTGSLFSATLNNHTAVRVYPSHYLGTRYWGALFDVQDARMSRVHGCTGETFVPSFWACKKKVLADKNAKQILIKKIMVKTDKGRSDK